MTDARQPVATGGCQCGAVRYAFYAPLENSHVCHCRMCQRATGGLFAALAGGALANFAWTRGTPAFFPSSNLARRAFCEKCGTPLSFHYEDETARMYVTMGSLDHPERAGIVRQFGVESRLPWVKFCEDIPGEITGNSEEEQQYLAKMRTNQGPARE